MKEGFRQSMAWLHTWAGLVVGWILFFVFLTGTAGYFHYEIDRWMQPERPLPQAGLTPQQALAAGERYLQAHAPGAGQWTITLPGLRDSPDLMVSWRAAGTPAGGRGQQPKPVVLDPATGAPATFVLRETGGGRELYVMHWKLAYLPEMVGVWIVGSCTMAMLVAILSGVVAHRRIFADFFTFRRGKGQRSWLDAHNALSVLALPYHLMITYSGLVFFALTLMPWAVTAAYGPGGGRAFGAESNRRGAPVARASGTPAPLVPLAAVLAAAERTWQPGEVRSLTVQNPGDAAAVVVANRFIGGRVSRSRDNLRFDGRTGALLGAGPVEDHPPGILNAALLGLHEGLFGGPLVRALFFLSGLAGTAMVATGLVLWTAKRRAQQDRGRPGGRAERVGGPVVLAAGKERDGTGLALVERLNVGTIAGLPAAIAVYFWANRLLPVGLAGRADAEIHALFIAWLLLMLYPAVRGPRRAWTDELWLGAALYALLPLLNAATTDRHLGVTLPHAFATGDWMLAGFDLATLGIAGALAFAARRTGRRLHGSRAPAGVQRRTSAT